MHVAVPLNILFLLSIPAALSCVFKYGNLDGSESEVH